MRLNLVDSLALPFLLLNLLLCLRLLCLFLAASACLFLAGTFPFIIILREA